MDAANISAIISVVVLLALGGSFVINLREIRKSHRSTSEELKKIHDLVNSQLDKVKDKVEELEEKIESMGGPKAPPKRLPHE